MDRAPLVVALGHHVRMSAETEGTAADTGAPRILLIEDDEALGGAVAEALVGDGLRVLHVAAAPAARAAAREFRPDLALVDVGLPGGSDGFAVAETLRAESSIPIVFLTAADAVEDRLRGFEVGADDYVVKPFELPELLARMRAILRRTGRLQSARIELRGLVIDDNERRVTRNGVEIALTPLEFDLLKVLARSPGETFSKPRLLSLVWGFRDFDPNLVEVHMSSLRRKLERHGPRLIDTIRSAGYRIRA